MFDSCPGCVAPNRGISEPYKELPDGISSQNFTSAFVIDFAAYRKRRPQKELRVPPVVRYLRQAEEFQRRLEAGEARNRADLARQERLTRARITQLMELLRLHPLILDFVRQLKAGTPERLITERKLRRLATFAAAQQLHAAEKSVVSRSRSCPAPNDDDGALARGVVRRQPAGARLASIVDSAEPTTT